LEEDLKNAGDDEAGSLSPESTSTGSEYEETGNQNSNAEELSSTLSRYKLTRKTYIKWK
jgi:hypothetical protein